MKKNINEMLQELRNNKLTEISTGWDNYCESYKGLRQNTCYIVKTEEMFLKENYTCLCIAENGEPIEENVRIAYKLMLAQKFALPQII